MRPVGVKSIAVVSLLILIVGIGVYSERYQPGYLLNLSGESSFVLGLFTTLMGMCFYWLADLGNPSRTYFCRKPSVVPIDVPPFLMGIFSFLICFSIALLCFSTYSAALIFEVPRKVVHNSHICPIAENTVSKSEEPKIGCELIYRAFKLGYIKDLGACGAIENNERVELCTLRQFDEPLLHYSSRLFLQFINHTRSEWKDLVFWHRMWGVFGKQLVYINSILGKIKHVVGNSPRASHHIFTNLPNPNDSLTEFLDQWFHPNKCLSQYLNLANVAQLNSSESRSSSKAFDHVYGEMLFNPSYNEAVGLCKEYMIHWNSPIDSCERLAQAPQKFLKSIGIADHVNLVLKRFHEQFDIEVLKLQVKSIITGTQITPPPPEAAPANGEKAKALPLPNSIISFQCFMKVDKSQGSKVSKHPFQLFGYDYVAQDVRFPDDNETHQIHIEMYKYFAQAMAADFIYKGPSNRGDSATASQWHVGPEMLGSGLYPLTRLEYLKYVDLFSGSEWLQDRQDLLEVYPYYQHLHRFIELFRQDYESERTRL